MSERTTFDHPENFDEEPGRHAKPRRSRTPIVVVGGLAVVLTLDVAAVGTLAACGSNSSTPSTSFDYQKTAAADAMDVFNRAKPPAVHTIAGGYRWEETFTVGNTRSGHQGGCAVYDIIIDASVSSPAQVSPSTIASFEIALEDGDELCASGNVMNANVLAGINITTTNGNWEVQDDSGGSAAPVNGDSRDHYQNAITALIGHAFNHDLVTDDLLQSISTIEQGMSS